MWCTSIDVDASIDDLEDAMVLLLGKLGRPYNCNINSNNNNNNNNNDNKINDKYSDTDDDTINNEKLKNIVQVLLKECEWNKLEKVTFSFRNSMQLFKDFDLMRYDMFRDDVAYVKSFIQLCLQTLTTIKIHRSNDRCDYDVSPQQVFIMCMEYPQTDFTVFLTMPELKQYK